MIRVLIRIAVACAIALAGAIGLGRVLARQRTWGSADADDVGITTVLGGVQRSLRSPALRRLDASAWLGGIDLDLRHATPAVGGVEIRLEALLGGVKLTLPAGWRVEVERDLRSGSVEVRVPDASTLPDHAPAARIAARARLGGILVTTQPS